MEILNLYSASLQSFPLEILPKANKQKNGSLNKINNNITFLLEYCKYFNFYKRFMTFVLFEGLIIM